MGVTLQVKQRHTFSQSTIKNVLNMVSSGVVSLKLGGIKQKCLGR